jgi:hypothetical protein
MDQPWERDILYLFPVARKLKHLRNYPQGRNYGSIERVDRKTAICSITAAAHRKPKNTGILIAEFKTI